MKKLLVLALVLVAANAFAQTDPDPNGIGFYWDEGGVSNYLASAAPYSSLNIYLLATRLTESSGLSGWEAEVAITPAPSFPPTYTVNNAGLNVLTAPNFQVGMANALPYAPAMKLLTITLLNFGTPFSFAVGPCTPTSFPNTNSPGYAAGNDPGVLVPLTASCDVPLAGRPYFYTVATFMQTPPVATEPGSWSSVKNLYQ
ncbi:MAG: hypothetical protein ACYDIE_12035 [Candidatus Krumholzibacteriia bacterium]